MVNSSATASPGGSHVARCASGRGNIAFQRVVHHHAIGIEAPAKRADGSLHALDPAARQTVAITLVVQRNHFFAQRPVANPPPSRVSWTSHVGVRSARPDGESIHAVVSLGPPAIENRKVQSAIQDHLLTARARCLQRPPRIVQPDINALHQMAADVDVVVFDKDELICELRGCASDSAICCRTRLPGSSLGCALPAKTNCTGPFGIVHHGGQALDVRQKQVSSLVGRKAAGKSDSERVRTEYLAESLQNLAWSRRGARLVPRRGDAQTPAAAISG